MLMVWIQLLMPLAVKVLQTERQIPGETVTKTSTELVPSLGKYESIPEIKDTKLNSEYQVR